MKNNNNNYNENNEKNDEELPNNQQEKIAISPKRSLVKIRYKDDKTTPVRKFIEEEDEELV